MHWYVEAEDVLHEVLRVNLTTFGETQNSFFKLIKTVLPTAIWEGKNYNRLKSARNKRKRRVVSVDKMSHFHF